MHVFFSYIGGGGISPLALIAQQSGFLVSGSDKKDSSPYINLLKSHGVSDIGIGVSDEFIRAAHARQPIDWYVYSSAVAKEFPDHPEFVYCREHGIKMTKRDELLNLILEQKKLQLIAVAGTHGKTTTTAMVIWLLQQLGEPVSYSVGAKISFGEMGHYDGKSRYFVYECDEFDRNFLAFHPYLSLITGVTWDHHEIFPTQDDYFSAFSDFIDQSESVLIWQEDAARLNISQGEKFSILDSNLPSIEKISLAGRYNRLDGWLAVQAVHRLTQRPVDELVSHLERFPGVSRRFEQIVPNLYTDYAHTPEKITGAMSVAKEHAEKHNQEVVVVYEPLTNRRMHHLKDQHADVFKGVSRLYWVPSHLAREDPDLPVLTPKQLIGPLDADIKAVASPAQLDDALKEALDGHLHNGDLVLCMSGGGGGSLDEWLRHQYQKNN